MKKAVKAPVLKTYKLSTAQGPLISPSMTQGRAAQDRGACHNHIILGCVLDLSCCVLKGIIQRDI